jgi:serine/threonine-protein kinase HipA
MYKPVTHLEVYIWGKFIGAVALDPKLGYYAFAYDKQFGKSAIELSPLQMPLIVSEEPYIFTDLPEATYRRLPALLADALPDDFGNALIDRYMASKGLAKSQITTLDRLAYMGKRAMGALEFQPARGFERHSTVALEMNELVSEARQLLLGTFDVDTDIKTALRNLIAVGTSAGGARAKAVIAWNPKTEEMRSGQLELQQDFEAWLLKFDGMGVDTELGSSQDYGRIEYAYYLMAVDAGINMSASSLLQENGRAHFMTKRFDRTSNNAKHHIQTLCAMSHLDYKKKSTNSYEQLFMTIKELQLDRSDEIEAFQRMVFNVLGRNCDDHTKNFAFILRDGETWELAPAYDISFAHNPQGEWTNQHLMSVNNKFASITRADLLAVADRFAIGEATHIIEAVKEVISAWPTYAGLAGVSQHITKIIQNQHLLF